MCPYIKSGPKWHYFISRPSMHSWSHGPFVCWVTANVHSTWGQNNYSSVWCFLFDFQRFQFLAWFTVSSSSYTLGFRPLAQTTSNWAESVAVWDCLRKVDIFIAEMTPMDSDSVGQRSLLHNLTVYKTEIECEITIWLQNFWKCTSEILKCSINCFPHFFFF